MTYLVATHWLRYSIVAAFCASALFLAAASFLMPWWQSLAGRTLVLIDALWAVSLFPLFLSAVTGIRETSVFYIEYYAASLSLAALATVWRIWALWAVRKRRRTRAGKPAAGDDGP